MSKETEETEDYILTYKNSNKVKDKVFDSVVAFCKKHEAFSGEDIFQSDDPQIYAPELIAIIAEDVIKFRREWKND